MTPSQCAEKLLGKPVTPTWWERQKDDLKTFLLYAEFNERSSTLMVGVKALGVLGVLFLLVVAAPLYGPVWLLGRGVKKWLSQP